MEKHIIPMFLNRAETYGTKEVFRYKDKNGKYQSLNWSELRDKVERLCAALEAAGVKNGDMVGIYSQNKPQWIITDLAVMALGGVVVPFYATATKDQLRYIINETNMKVLFAGDQPQLDNALDLAAPETTLEKIICFEKPLEKNDLVSGFDAFMNLPAEGSFVKPGARLDQYQPGDLATVIYTSGTTGEPKGVMLDHENFMYCFQIHDQRLDVQSTDVSLCFLPLSHVFERMWSHYLLYRGAVNVFLENPKEVIQTLPEVRPTLMCTVPRFFDKTYAGIHDEMRKWPGLKQKIFKWSVKQGLKAIEYRCRNQSLPFLLSVRHNMANFLVLKKLRGIFGDNIKTFPCAGAAINTEILKFFHSTGLFVNYGYGATETTATVSCFRDDEYFFGTCGTIMPGVEVKIAENSEILVKGKTVFKGYYKKEKETGEVLKDGWFYTGDEGYMDDKNNLIMVDRIKDLMKTSVGKYVSPQKLEMVFSTDELIEQMIVVGDNRQFVSALIVPAMEKLEQFAQQHQISFTDREDLVASPELYRLLQERFTQLQKDITPYERVVKFTLLSSPFSIEEGTMTSTLKLRRSSIEKMYKDLVEKMYE